MDGVSGQSECNYNYIPTDSDEMFESWPEKKEKSRHE